MSKKRNKRFSKISRTVKDFIKDEQGFITRENILAVGMTTLSLLSFAGKSYSQSKLGDSSGGSTEIQACDSMAQTHNSVVIPERIAGTTIPWSMVHEEKHPNVMMGEGAGVSGDASCYNPKLTTINAATHSSHGQHFNY